MGSAGVEVRQASTSPSQILEKIKIVRRRSIPKLKYL
jgi:hypothetical protein